MEEEKFTDGFKGEGEMLERGGGAHLSSHSHIPVTSHTSRRTLANISDFIIS